MVSISKEFTPKAWPLDRLKPYEGNPRVITSAAVEKVVASLLEFGWAGQYPVADAAGVTIIGHTRHLAAQAIHERGLEIPGWPDTATLPVIQRGDLSAEQVRALRIMDNRAHQESAWDLSKLTVELGSFEELDVALTGFDMPEVEDLLGQVSDMLNGAETGKAPAAKSSANGSGDSGDPPATTPTPGTEPPATTPSPQRQYDTQATIGEYRFAITRDAYSDWLEDIRQEVGFEKQAVIAEIRRRLGLPA